MSCLKSLSSQILRFSWKNPHIVALKFLFPTPVAKMWSHLVLYLYCFSSLLECRFYKYLLLLTDISQTVSRYLINTERMRNKAILRRLFLFNQILYLMICFCKSLTIFVPSKRKFVSMGYYLNSNRNRIGIDI